MDAIFDRLAGLVVIDRGTRSMRLASDDVRNAVKAFFWPASPELNSPPSPISLSEVLAQITIYCIQYLLAEVQDEYLRSEDQAVCLLQREPLLAHSVFCCGNYYRMFYPEPIPAQSSKGKQTEEAVKESVDCDSAKAETKGEEEETPNATGEKDKLGPEDLRKQELQNAPKEALPPNPEVSALASQLIKDEKKRTLVVLLATYLSNDSLTLSLNWTELCSWVESMSMLHVAARLGLADQAADILKQDPSLVSERDQYNSMPLHEAVKGGFEDVVRILLGAGAKVLEKDNSEQSSWDYVMRSSHDGIFVLLFEKMCQDQGGETSMSDAGVERYLKCIGGGRGTRKDQLGQTLIHTIKKRIFEATDLLLRNKADPNYLDDKKIPVLHHAIQGCSSPEGEVDMYPFVRLLLEYDADPLATAQDERGESALHVATLLSVQGTRLS